MQTMQTMQSIILLTMYMLQLSCSSFIDPVRISFNGVGTRIYEECSAAPDCEIPLHRCETPDNPSGPDDNPCIVISNTTGNRYYAPLTGPSKTHEEFEVSCSYFAKMKITYKVASCGIPTDQKKIHSTLFFNNIQQAKTSFSTASSDESFTDDELSEQANECTPWARTSFEVTPTITVLPNVAANIQIRNRLLTASQYAALYDVIVECEHAPPIPSPPMGPVYSHDSFCITNLNTDRYNGEYAHLEGPQVYGKPWYKKDDSNGIAYICATGAAVSDAWAIVNDKQNPLLTYAYTFMCPSDIENPNEDGFEDCELKARGGVIVVAGIVNGECTDHYRANIFIMLVVLSLFCFISGMMTLYCCQLGCYGGKHARYKKVDFKDIDIDF